MTARDPNTVRACQLVNLSNAGLPHCQSIAVAYHTALRLVAGAEAAFEAARAEAVFQLDMQIERCSGPDPSHRPYWTERRNAPLDALRERRRALLALPNPFSPEALAASQSAAQALPEAA